MRHAPEKLARGPHTRLAVARETALPVLFAALLVGVGFIGGSNVLTGRPHRHESVTQSRTESVRTTQELASAVEGRKHT